MPTLSGVIIFKGPVKMKKQLFAIVDIETTGGYARDNGITEIAIVLHDGSTIVDTFETLINPNHTIPKFIQLLTGITDAMVEDAPQFNEVAPDIYELLKDAVFVAHNVNFDYSFVNYFLSKAGFHIQSKKLCTVRLARKIIPGHSSYSLGKLCRQLNIPLSGRHRAMGDAYATALLFSLLLQEDKENHITESLKTSSKEQFIPPNLPKEQLIKLPESPGVYYFYNKQSKVVYVGKAKNIRKRVHSHFSNNKATKQKQDFLNTIYSISYELCGTELMAVLLESVEIKRLWPEFNRSQKNFEPVFAIYDYVDQNGYVRLGIDKIKKTVQPLATFRLYNDALVFLQKIVGEYELCPKLSGTQNTRFPCVGFEKLMCKGACEAVEMADDYNQRMQLLIDELDDQKPTFAVRQKGRTHDEQSFLLVEKGRFYGMGYASNDTAINSIDDLKTYITPLKENFYVRHTIIKYAEENPDKVFSFRMSIL